MSNILLTIPMHTGDAAVGERLIDWCFQLNNRVALGNALLVFSHDLHDEYRTKLRLAAEVAFETVDVLNAQPIADSTKPAKINRTFQQAAEAIQKHFQWPFLWLEPDCVPLKRGWLSDLHMAYEAQPKRYLAAHLKMDAKTDEAFMGRIAIYPNNAATELAQFTGNSIHFERAGAGTLLARTTKTRLIQAAAFDPEKGLAGVRQDAMLLHSDKTGELIRLLAKPNDVLVPDHQITTGGIVKPTPPIAIAPPPPLAAPVQNDFPKPPLQAAPKPRRVPWLGLGSAKRDAVLNEKG